MDDEIRAAKEAAAGKSSELGGDGPVTQMRGALKVLKAELRQLSLRQACLQHTLAAKGSRPTPVSYTHLTLPTTPYV